MTELEPLERTTKRLQNMTPKERETYINTVASQAEDYTPTVQQFTDASKIFYKDFHALLVGKTRQGKTTLLYTMIKKFFETNPGITVLLRDDGGLEFLYLARFFKTRVFIPNDANVNLIPIGFECTIERFDGPQDIIEKVWQYNFPLNVIVYDVFSLSSADKARFYSELFMRLLFHVQQMRKADKRLVLFCIDELNDLIPPKGKGNPEMAITRADVEQNIRKLGKHQVRLIGSAHRFNQVGLDTRSQFEQVYIKKCYGYDAWDFLSKNLVTSNTATFWKMIKHVLKMPKNEFLLFDENQNYDFYTIPDIPRPNPVEIDVEAIGFLPIQTKETKSSLASQKYLWKAVTVLQRDKYSDMEIAKLLGTTPQNFSQMLQKAEKNGLIQ